MKEIKKFLLDNKIKNILIAVSGGVDSIVLLKLLHDLSTEIDLNLEVAHFDHLSRNGRSTKDRYFVEGLANQYNLMIHTASGSMSDYSKKNKISEEEAGRILRHNFFNDILENKEDDWYIALAHNLDDQVETILMRIIRGTGSKGLEGMHKIDGKIVRPLLDTSKSDIVSYAESNKLSYVQDQTNFESKYHRNKIRNELLPFIKNEYNPNIYESIIGLSTIVKNQNEMVEIIIDEKYHKCIVSESSHHIVFDKNLLSKCSDYEQTEVIRLALDKIKSSYNFTGKHYEEILKLIISKKASILVLNEIAFYNSLNTFNIRIVIENDLEQPIELSNFEKITVNSYLIKAIDIDPDTKIRIRKRQNGDKIRIKGSYKKLKDLLNDKKVDVYERDFIPVVEIDNEIYALGNLYNIDKSNLEITKTGD